MPKFWLAFNLGRNFTTLGRSLIAKYRKQGRAGREASVSYSVNTLVRKAAIWLSIKIIELFLGIELKIVIKRLVQFCAFSVTQYSALGIDASRPQNVGLCNRKRTRTGL